MIFFSIGVLESSNLEIILGVSCVVSKPMPVLWIYKTTFKLFMLLVTHLQKRDILKAKHVLPKKC